MWTQTIPNDAVIFTTLYSAVICWDFSQRHNDFKPGFTSESPGTFLFDCPRGSQAASPVLTQYRVSGNHHCSHNDSLHVCNDSNHIMEICHRERAHLLHFCPKKYNGNCQLPTQGKNTTVTDHLNCVLQYTKKEGGERIIKIIIVDCLKKHVCRKIPNNN